MGHKKRLTAVGCVLALAGTALVAGPTAAAPDTSEASATAATADSQALEQSLAAAPSQGLQTPFEASNGANWTTVEEAQTFLEELDADSKRVALQQVGESVEGRPLNLVTVGSPAPESQEEVADGSMMLFNCSIHGDEPSGREGCLQLARDLSTTTDPAWKRLLNKTTVGFTFINPDGWEADTRENADDVDINRDFLALATPEAQALATVMRDWNPDVINDLHEFGPREFYDTQALVLWPRNRNVDATIHDLSERMVNNYTGAQIEANGMTSGIYGLLVKDGEPFQQVAGDHQARILRNYTGLKHITGQLTEAAQGPVTPEEENDPQLANRRAVDVQYASAVGSLAMISENRTRLARQSAQAAERATQAGAEQAGVVYFSGQDNMLPTTSDGAEPHPMCGYQLTEAQLSELGSTLELHEITWEENAEGAFVTMAQPGKTLIPLLLDERAEYGLTEATPLDDC
ncbi:M14 family zinc carboxypeptidase [Citricoccus sp.]|uniref:M14 family zinc carboxypeptidase n=2 Tax=Citricoccus sp. TaxID=1978372 RepID=UPI0028BE2B6A|nr:M14 family zinc carboxypeptidase [Citricoccus sp.]